MDMKGKCLCGRHMEQKRVVCSEGKTGGVVWGYFMWCPRCGRVTGGKTESDGGRIYAIPELTRDLSDLEPASRDEVVQGIAKGCAAAAESIRTRWRRQGDYVVWDALSAGLRALATALGEEADDA